MNLLRLHLLLALLPVTAAVADLPDPPAGHVLDRADWMPRQETKQLETELSRLRREHRLDVIVVVWDRDLPAGQDAEHLARQLGQGWAREEFWAIVLQMPESAGRPVVAYDGPVITRPGPELVDESLRNATNRGMKEWSDPARLRSVALEVAEELVYLRLRRQFEQDGITKAEAEASAATRRTTETLLMRITIAAMTGILIFGTIIAIRLCIRRRGPAELTFPPTRWRRRLNAPWCGGSDLVATFNPPDPS